MSANEMPLEKLRLVETYWGKCWSTEVIQATEVAVAIGDERLKRREKNSKLFFNCVGYASLNCVKCGKIWMNISSESQ